MTISEFLSSDTVEPSVLAYLIARENSWLRYEVDQIGAIISVPHSEQGYEQLSAIARDLRDFLSQDVEKRIDKLTRKLLKLYKKRDPELKFLHEELALEADIYSKVHLDFLKEFLPDALKFLDKEGNPKPTCVKEFKKRFELERELDHSEAKDILLHQQQSAFGRHVATHPEDSSRGRGLSKLSQGPQIKHVVFTHPDLEDYFSDERDLLPQSQAPQTALFWFIFPLGNAEKPANWLIVNANLGYTSLVEAPDSTADIEGAIISIIHEHLSHASAEFKVSISPSPQDIIWSEAAGYPKHVIRRLNEVGRIILKQPSPKQARASILALNHKKISINGRSFTPVEGMNGLLTEIAVNHAEYLENTNPIKRLWHRLIGKPGWMHKD